MPLNSAKTVEFCPLVGYSRQAGPNVATSSGTVDVSATAFAFGRALGGVVSTSPQFDFIPFVGAFYTTSKATGTLGSASTSSSSNYSEIDVGAGFVLNKIVTIRPGIAFPIGLSNSDPSYGVSFAINFGTAPKSASKSR
jgi:hypothetical protein